jgi:lipopolysaccharide assembly outer membrane protein LptD (OstA)
MKFKVSLVTLFIVTLFTSTVFAAMPVIKADRQYFDIASGLHVLSGNVYITHNNRAVTAGTAKTNMLEIWASGGVTYTDNDIYLAGNTVYVSFPTHSAQVDNTITFTRGDLKISADHGNYNWKTKVASFNGNVQLTQNEASFRTDSINYNVETDTLYDDSGAIVKP